MLGACSRVLLGCLVLLGAGCGSAAIAAPAAPVAPAARGIYIGVFERGVPESYGPVTRFTAATGVKPNIVLYYSGWNERFQLEFARAAHAHGALPLVQIDPDHISVRAIAAGKYDSYLAAYGRAVRAYDHAVIIGFGHEMNGRWYSWGWQHTSPAVWVAAWRHIVTVMRRAGATNAIWMWTIDAIVPFAAASPRAWWPGAQYVTWVGIDGYLGRAGDTFSTVFPRTIAVVRKLTRKPILISETAISEAAGKAEMLPGLFAGIRRYWLSGLVWFDVAQPPGPYAHNWRLEGNRAAVSTFRAWANALRIKVIDT